MKTRCEPRGAGDSAVARFAGSIRIAWPTWGLRPRLYAFVRFADSKTHCEPTNTKSFGSAGPGTPGTTLATLCSKLRLDYLNCAEAIAAYVN
jgi:hypothetical protein